jgi:ABC-type glycerol-3-phosphate transport system permease component
MPIIDKNNDGVTIATGTQRVQRHYASWNTIVAAAIIYVLPPIVLLFALRCFVVAGPNED